MTNIPISRIRNLVGLPGIPSLINIDNWSAAVDPFLGEVIHKTLPSLSLCACPTHLGNMTQKGLGTIV